MFDKNKFSILIKEILSNYDNQREFAKYNKISRSFISGYMNLKNEKPPKPETLQKLADASKGSVTYSELMQACGYSDYIIDDFFDGSIQNIGNKVPIIDTIKYDENKKIYITIPTQKYAYTNIEINPDKEYVAIVSHDDSMIPLIGNGDIVIIEKTNEINNGKAHLLVINNRLVLRRVIKLNETDYELEPLNMRYPKENLSNIHVIGEVVSVEIKSAFN